MVELANPSPDSFVIFNSDHHYDNSDNDYYEIFFKNKTTATTTTTTTTNSPEMNIYAYYYHVTNFKWLVWSVLILSKGLDTNKKRSFYTNWAHYTIKIRGRNIRVLD